MPVRTTRNRADIPPNASFLEFTVYRGPEDGRACGYLNFGHQSAEHRASAYAPYALTLDDAWQLACRFVIDNDIDMLWINDPENLLAPSAVQEAESSASGDSAGDEAALGRPPPLQTR